MTSLSYSWKLENSLNYSLSNYYVIIKIHIDEFNYVVYPAYFA